jgi:hypothetical protein
MHQTFPVCFRQDLQRFFPRKGFNLFRFLESARFW